MDEFQKGIKRSSTVDAKIDSVGIGACVMNGIGFVTRDSPPKVRKTHIDISSEHSRA